MKRVRVAQPVIVFALHVTTMYPQGCEVAGTTTSSQRVDACTLAAGCLHPPAHITSDSPQVEGASNPGLVAALQDEAMPVAAQQLRQGHIVLGLDLAL